MGLITNIYLKENISLVTLAGAVANVSFLSRVFGDIADAKINVDMISQTAPMGKKVTLSFTVDNKDMVKVLELSKSITKSYPEVKPLVSGNYAKISLFSEDMPEECGVAAKVFEILEEEGIEIAIITTSETDVSILVNESIAATAYEKLKEKFCV